MIKDLYPEYYEELPQFNEKKKKKLDQEMGKGLEDISPKMIYKWPANIRKGNAALGALFA